MFYSSQVYKWLDEALDNGITEEQFWNSTIAELNRLFRSRERIHKTQLKEQATMHYQLAQLIGKATAVHLRGKGSMPDISTVYPSLFDQVEYQEKKQAKQAEIFAVQLKQFANFHNQNLAKEAAKD